MNIEITECPFCHGNEFAEGRQDGYASIGSKENIWHSATLYHVICLRCGSVVRSYVKRPEKMLKKKDRKED